MSALMHPVGPRSSRVYWLRRLVVLAALVGVVALVLVVANAVLGRTSATGATGGAAAEASDEAAVDESGEDAEAGDEQGAQAAVDGPAACTAEQLSIALSADGRTYPAGADPVFTVTLTNLGDSSCTVDASEVNRQILVTSGNDRIWASNDCPADTDDRLLLLASGARDEVAVTWPRVRSDASCSDGLPEPRPGTYTAVVDLAGVSSTAVVFELS